MVINSLVASMYVYKMQVLPNMSNNLIKRIERIFNIFLWNGRRPKISVDKLMNRYDQGGLNLVNLKNKEKALKASWVSDLSHEDFLAELAYRNLSEPLRETIWKCNLSSLDVQKLFPDSFWKDVLMAWAELNLWKIVN